MKRILASAALIALFILIAATVIAGLTGAPANILLALLFCEIAIPGLSYVFIIITKQIRRLNKVNKAEPDTKKTPKNSDKSELN